MTLVEVFEKEMPAALARLEQEEWALTSIRERVLAEADSAIAFECVVAALRLAAAQTDHYAFATCCWLAMDFARCSGTTQEPEGLRQALDAVAVTAHKFGAGSELLPLCFWYRLPPNQSLEPTRVGKPPLAAQLQR